MKAVIIGAGNLATHLSLSLQRAGMDFLQVYSHTDANARELALRLHCKWTTSLEEIRGDANLYIFSVKDSVLEEVVRQVSPNEGLWIHTSGSMPISLFEGHAEHYGVLYPLQTFSKARSVDFTYIPIFLEANNQQTSALLKWIGDSLSVNVRFLSTEKRRYLHLAAVFACNFTNHIYSIADKILSEQEIPGNVLLPLIDETAAKIHDMAPAEAQTGPAVRFDENVMDKQLALIDDEDIKTLYRLISNDIHKEATDNEQHTL
jgi:predicted short-subunit dehydrogenase-like oxidoreductase (DUF2520 family)